MVRNPTVLEQCVLVLVSHIVCQDDKHKESDNCDIPRNLEETEHVVEIMMGPAFC